MFSQNVLIVELSIPSPSIPFHILPVLFPKWSYFEMPAIHNHCISSYTYTLHVLYYIIIPSIHVVVYKFKSKFTLSTESCTRILFKNITKLLFSPSKYTRCWVCLWLYSLMLFFYEVTLHLYRFAKEQQSSNQSIVIEVQVGTCKYTWRVRRKVFLKLF